MKTLLTIFTLVFTVISQPVYAMDISEQLRRIHGDLHWIPLSVVSDAVASQKSSEPTLNVHQMKSHGRKFTFKSQQDCEDEIKNNYLFDGYQVETRKRPNDTRFDHKNYPGSNLVLKVTKRISGKIRTIEMGCYPIKVEYRY